MYHSVRGAKLNSVSEEAIRARVSSVLRDGSPARRSPGPVPLASLPSAAPIPQPPGRQEVNLEAPSAVVPTSPQQTVSGLPTMPRARATARVRPGRKRPLQPLQRRAWGRCPTPPLPWRSAPPSAAKSVPWCCTSGPMRSRCIRMYASPSPSAAGASPCKSCATCPWPRPTRWPASCRAPVAPRCR